MIVNKRRRGDRSPLINYLFFFFFLVVFFFAFFFFAIPHAMLTSFSVNNYNNNCRIVK